MIRVVIYLIIVGLFALGAAWLADRPGDVVITWQNQRIETSVMVLIIAVMAFATLAVMLWSVVRAILRSPDILWMYLRTRRGVRGYLAVSQGLIAIGSGDARAARKFADEASRIAPERAAHAAAHRASGAACRRSRGGRAYVPCDGRARRYSAARPARTCSSRRSAATIWRPPRNYAEEAAKSNIGAGLGRPRGARLSLRGRRLDRRARAARSQHEGRADRSSDLSTPARRAADGARARAPRKAIATSAKPLALEAVKLAPTLVPAAALAGRLLGEAGELRKAARIVETAWKANPHPDLADTYAHLRPGDSARDRLARVQTLARQGARQYRRRAGGGARGARCAGVCDRARGAGAAR